METTIQEPKSGNSKDAKNRKAVKRLILVIGDKGGTGKSTFSRILGETHRQAEKSTLLVDADGTVGQMLQFLGERNADGRLVPQPQSRDGVTVFTLHGTETDRDNLTELLKSGAETIVVDLPAVSLTILRNVQNDIDYLRLVDETGYALTLVSLLTPFRASIRGIGDALELAPKATHVVVRNLNSGDEDDFELWEASAAKKTLAERGGMLIDMPRLKARIAAKLDKDNIRYHDAPDASVLTLADRSRSRKWLDEAKKNLEPAHEALGLI